MKKSQVLERNAHTMEGSDELWAYAKGLIEKNAAEGKLLEE